MHTVKWLSWVGVVGVLLGLVGCRGTRQVAMLPPPDAVHPVAERVVGGLQDPVALVFLSKDVWLVAERPSGRIRWIERGKLRAEPFAVVPVPGASDNDAVGLLGLAAGPQESKPSYVYACYTVPGSGTQAVGQRIVRFTVNNGHGVAMTTIVDKLPVGARFRNGGRLLFGNDGKLYVTVGDTERPALAQNYDALSGKVLRYNPDGSIPADNPLEEQKTTWAGTANDDDQRSQPMGLRTPVYVIGLRNPRGLAQNPHSNALYITDTGPDRDDRVARLLAGDNYGWPEVTGMSNDPRFHPPVWASGTVSINPTGAAFYTGSDFPQFDGNLFFAAAHDGKLRRVALTNPDRADTVEIVTAAGSDARLDVAMGPDGYLYFTSREAIYRLRPTRTAGQ